MVALLPRVTCTPGPAPGSTAWQADNLLGSSTQGLVLATSTDWQLTQAGAFQQQANGHARMCTRRLGRGAGRPARWARCAQEGRACSWLGLVKRQKGPEPSRASVASASTRPQSCAPPKPACAQSAGPWLQACSIWPLPGLLGVQAALETRSRQWKHHLQLRGAAAMLGDRRSALQPPQACDMHGLANSARRAQELKPQRGGAMATGNA